MAAPGGIIDLPPGMAGTPAPGADDIADPGGIIEPPPGIELPPGTPRPPGMLGALDPGIEGADGIDVPGIEGMLGVLCASSPAGARVTASAAIATVMVFMKPS